MNQQGTVEPLANGRFRVRFRIGRRLRTLDTFDLEGDAESFRAHYASQLIDDDPEKDITVADLGDKALTKRELRGKLSDPGSDWSRFRNHIEKDALGKLAARLLQRHHIDAWLERLEDKDLAEQTIRNCRNVLSAICEHAVSKRLLKSNPCLGIRREPEKRTDEPWTFADQDEQDRLITCAYGAGEVVGAIVAFAIGSGLREGEQCALRLVDVHLDSADPHVMVRYGGPPTVKHPKGRPPKWGRIRRVQLFGVAKRALERWLPQLAGVRNPHGLVFPRLGGTRWDAGGYRDRVHILPWEVWKGAPEKVTKRGKLVAARVGLLERAGITRDFRWHDLRHTCGSSLVSGWWGRRWDLIEVRDLLGHKDITTTQRYAQLGETASKRAGREAEAMFHACSTPAQVGGIAPITGNFLNRRSAVRLCPGAPNDSGDLGAAAAPGAPFLGTTWNTARALLEAAAAGDAATARALAATLAEGVLSSPLVTLALRANAGDITAAIDLAQLLDGEGAARAQGG